MNNQQNPASSEKDVFEGSTLFRRTVKGGFWMSFLTVVARLLDTLKIWLLANMLGISKWGLLSLSLLAIDIIAIFTETGFQAALIQKKETVRDYLDTVWTTGLIRAVVLGLALYLFAPYAASFFDGKAQFERYHLVKPGDLAVRLRNASDEVSASMSKDFSWQTRLLLEQYDAKSLPSPQLEEALVGELNRLVAGSSLYPMAKSTHTELSDYALGLAEQAQKDGNFQRLNRRILQEAYPGFVKESIIDVPTMKTIIQILSFCVVIGAFTNIGTISFKRDLQFKNVFFFETASKLVDIAVTLVVVFLYRNVWALVWGRMASVLSRCIISYIVCEYRPRICMDIAKARALWRFGRWISLFGILSFIAIRGSDIFLGKYLGPAMMGIYLLAYRFALLPSTEITAIFSEVTFPAFAKMQDDIARLRSAYLKIYHFTAFLTVPFCGFIFVLAPEFVRLFMKQEFYAMVPIVQVLAFQGLLHSLNSTIGPVYRGTGRPWISLYLQIIRIALLCVLIYPMTVKWGVIGTAWLTLLIMIIMQPLVYYMLIRTIRCSVPELFKPVMPPLAATTAMVAVVMLSRSLFFPQASFVSLFILGLAGIVTYIGSACICEKLFGYQIRQTILEQLSVLLKKK